jgi:ferredoxin
VDEPITIRELHRDTGLATEAAFPAFEFPDVGKKVAVIGSGPAGLSCAWALRQRGYDCTVFDALPKAGGTLRDNDALPMDVLDAEVEWLEQSGIVFELGSAISMHGISAEFDGVVFAEAEASGTHFADAFYAEEHKLAVKAVANGKAAALALDRFLKGDATEVTNPFDSKIGKLRDSELQELVKNCTEHAERPEPQVEAARCLHCDCRKPVSCKLRIYSERYGADQREFPADERKHVQLIGHNEAVVFEPGKCIKCGLCVKITKRAGEELGLAFVGRGFNTQVAVPFGETLQSGLKSAARECVEACPTGALAFRTTEEKKNLTQSREGANGAKS